MNDDNIIYLYHSIKRDSWSEVGAYIYIEYAIQPITDEKEKDKIASFGFSKEAYGYYHPVKSILRSVTVNSSGQLSFSDWDLMNVSKTELGAALSFSDGYYLNNTGKSLHYLYDESIRIHNKNVSLLAELDDLENSIIPHKFQAYSNLQQEYQNKLNQELKDRRLYSKAQKGLVNPDIMAEIMNPIKAEYQTEYNRINNRIDEIKTELEELKSKYS